MSNSDVVSPAAADAGTKTVCVVADWKLSSASKTAR